MLNTAGEGPDSQQEHGYTHVRLESTASDSKGISLMSDPLGLLGPSSPPSASPNRALDLLGPTTPASPEAPPIAATQPTTGSSSPDLDLLGGVSSPPPPKDFNLDHCLSAPWEEESLEPLPVLQKHAGPGSPGPQRFGSEAEAAGAGE